jgi:hypothetical protein
MLMIKNKQIVKIIIYILDFCLVLILTLNNFI